MPPIVSNIEAAPFAASQLFKKSKSAKYVNTAPSNHGFAASEGHRKGLTRESEPEEVLHGHRYDESFDADIPESVNDIGTSRASVSIVRRRWPALKNIPVDTAAT
jgi:hypothetical protein